MDLKKYGNYLIHVMLGQVEPPASLKKCPDF